MTDCVYWAIVDGQDVCTCCDVADDVTTTTEAQCNKCEHRLTCDEYWAYEMPRVYGENK